MLLNTDEGSILYIFLDIEASDPSCSMQQLRLFFATTAVKLQPIDMCLSCFATHNDHPMFAAGGRLHGWSEQLGLVPCATVPRNLPSPSWLPEPV